MSVFADSAKIVVSHEQILQGEPLMVTIQNTNNVADIKDIIFDGKQIPFFLYLSLPTAFIGIDLNAKQGEHTLQVSLRNGETLIQSVIVSQREKIDAPLGIPEKLGGNTQESQKKLVVSLAKENDILNTVVTSKKKLWTGKFIYPVLHPIVVDSYGYTRHTGKYSIAHKGTDFKAPEGTVVYAMNRGIVRIVKKSKIYGNMVVIDHGLGLMTFYMHLSKSQVKVGQIVEQGKIIGLSGQTGYSLGPHLHLTVRLNNTSIDPVKFMDFFTH
jgi:murein DD-endopeptidase MepM/ murein hydrolase activator NlpD